MGHLRVREVKEYLILKEQYIIFGTSTSLEIERLLVTK